MFYLWQEITLKQIAKYFLGRSLWLSDSLNPYLQHYSGFEIGVREFYFKKRRYLIKCFACHASPGVFELTSALATRVLLTSKANLKFLNVGGGTGQLSRYFSSIGFDVTSIDIQILEENKNNIRFDLNTDDYSKIEGVFDVVLIQEVIEHIENPWHLLREMKKKLATNGIIILTTPNIFSSLSLKRAHKERCFEWFSSDCLDYHINPIPYFEVELICKKIGLEIVGLFGNGEAFFGQSLSKKSLIEDNETLIYLLKVNDKV